MIGLIFLGMLAVCAVAAIFIARAGARMGEKQWGGWKGKLAGGTLAILLASLPMTWDTIPTIISYRQQCQTAGLQVFKDVERWRSENPGAEVRIKRKKGNSIYDYPEKVEPDGMRRRILNSQFSYFSRFDVSAFSAVGTHEIVDVQKNEKLVRWRVIGTGKGDLKFHKGIDSLDDFKFWLNFETCGQQQSKFSEKLGEFKSMGIEND